MQHHQALRDALPDETLVIHATLGRPQNKAVVEGKVGLFAQDLGPVVAVVDTSTTERIALTVAEAAVGLISRGLVLIVWTERDEDTIRIISARWATKHEQNLYYNYLKENG